MYENTNGGFQRIELPPYYKWTYYHYCRACVSKNGPMASTVVARSTMKNQQFDINSHPVTGNGQCFQCWNEIKEKWSVLVRDGEYLFQYDNMQSVEEQPFCLRKYNVVGSATDEIDRMCVWNSNGSTSAKILNQILHDFNIPKELWNKVKIWVKRNYNWKE